MQIKANNQKDLQKFYRYLFFYRSFLFYFITFTTKNKKNEIQSIINALNIKNRKKRITYIFDYTCQYIDNFYQGQNICGFKNDCCIIQQETNLYRDGCCRLCKYKGNHGCTSKNISCKLFICSNLKEKYKTLAFKDLLILKCFSLSNQIIIKHNYFTKKEIFLRDLYCGSALLWAIKSIFRNFYMIKEYFKQKKMY